MRSLQNTFGRPAADRHTIQRSSNAWILRQRDDPATRFVVSGDSGILVNDAPALVRLAQHDLPEGWQEWQPVYLGELQQASLFAIEVPTGKEAHFSAIGKFEQLRPLALTLPEAEAAMAAHLRAVFHWHSLNRFCGGCGAPLHASAAGHSRRCIEAGCTIGELFPRIDPAVIVLVTHEDKCLLGRQQAWPAGRFSCLAGFAEAGETLEEVVRREVFEEAGVHVTDIEYHSSQPWPFPQSLMLGFRARAISPGITLHDDELEDARWFSRQDIRNGLAGGTLQASARLSIAWRLLHDWYAEAGDPADLDTHAV